VRGKPSAHVSGIPTPPISVAGLRDLSGGEASEYKAAKKLLKKEEEKERQLGAVKQAPMRDGNRAGPGLRSAG